MVAPRKSFLEMRRDNVSSRRNRSTREERSAMMHNPLPKTICFISSGVLTSVDAIHGLLCHNRSQSILPLKMTLVVGIGNVSRRRSRPGPFSLELGDLADRMRHTYRHCACSISTGTPSTVQRRDSTWRDAMLRWS
jgi:hypothetical protein